MAIVYDQEEDFRSKMQKFGAKLRQQNKGNNENELNHPSTRKPRGKLIKSKAAGYGRGHRNLDPISINIESIKSKIQFGRLVTYSVNCLANISENRFNCDSIVEQHGIETMKNVINHHDNNQAVMFYVGRTLKNIAETNPIYAQQITDNGILQQCIKILHSNPNETGIFAIDIMDSVFKSATDQTQKIIAQQIIQNNGLKILESVLLNNPNNPDLCRSIIDFMNTLMTIHPSITQQFGDKAIWNLILNAMKYHPKHANLAISGIESLKKLVLINTNYSSSIQQSGAVGIISKCMQCHPDLKQLTYSGVTALKLLAGHDDISQALIVLFDFGKYDDMMISQALGLLGNLALIEENAQFIVAKGGLDCFMNLINYKCKKQDLSPDEVAMVANNVRAMGRLLEDDKVIQSFVNKGGLDLLKDIMEYYDDEESIMNAVIDALGNLARNNKEYIFGTDIEITATNLICKHPEYGILMQKYGDLLSNLSIDNVLNAGLLKGIQQSLLINYSEPETVRSMMDIIKHILMANPKLAQQIADENTDGIIQAIKHNSDDTKVLAKILDAIYEISKIDAKILNYYLKTVGLEDELLKILKEESLSDKTAAIIKTFADSVSLNDIDCDLSNIFTALKGLGMDLNKLTKSVQEIEVKHDSDGSMNDIEAPEIDYNIQPMIGNGKVYLEEISEALNYTEYDAETLMTKMRETKDPPMIIGNMKEICIRLQGGDDEVYNSVVSGGGIGDLLVQANGNMGNPAPLGATLDAVCILSKDQRLKQLLGMHGTIRLILEVMRRHSNDIELLDKCCYILSNLSFNNEENMTAIIELGGVSDIIGIIQKHNSVNFICESAINVLINLCHNSDKNKVLIARSGGDKVCISTLNIYNRCLNDGDEAAVISCFKCLANLAYISDNVKQLIKFDVVAHVLDALNINTDKHDLIEMGVVVLANLSSHERTAVRMINLGVLHLIIKISQTYPNEMEIQRSCLGCIGNLMNDQSNAVTFIDKKGHLRVYEIMQELVFEESVIITALKLLKILATNTDIATEMVLDGGCKVVEEIMNEYKENEEILSLGFQALCKMIVTMEAAQHITNNDGDTDNLCNFIIKIAKDNNNWANIQIMNELIKVIVNISCIEDNAQNMAKHGGISILRAIEAHKTNAIFLNNAAMALTKMSSHPLSSSSLIKYGAIPVILTSMQTNPTRKGILTRYIRTLTNFLYTQHKTVQELERNNGYQIVVSLAKQYPNYQALQTELKRFEKAIKISTSHQISSIQQSQSQQCVRDNLDILIIRFLTSGGLIKKYHENGKSKKKILRVNDDCNMLIFEDPTGKKTAKQLNLRSLNDVIPKKGTNIIGMEKCNENNSFILITTDPNGREFKIGLECKTNIEMKKWMNGLKNITKIMKQYS